MADTRREKRRVGDYNIHVIGVPRYGPSDLYHTLLRAPWWVSLAVVAGAYLAVNLLFALLYVAGGGIHNARDGSLVDAFFFSVQTMGTIGYGSMYPDSAFANALVVAESVFGLAITAVATGLVFVRFSMTRARVVFSNRAAVGPVDGVPTFMVRIGNERRTQIVDATFRMTVTRKTRTAEGVTMYPSEEMVLVRNRVHALQRSWMLQHRITSDSPLHRATPESLAADEAEITLAVTGIDETSLQPINARHIWFARDVVWGARLADVISETADGDMVLDLRLFHELEQVEANEAGRPRPPA